MKLKSSNPIHSKNSPPPSGHVAEEYESPGDSSTQGDMFSVADLVAQRMNWETYEATSTPQAEVNEYEQLITNRRLSVWILSISSIVMAGTCIYLAIDYLAIDFQEPIPYLLLAPAVIFGNLVAGYLLYRDFSQRIDAISAGEEAANTNQDPVNRRP